MVMQLVMMMVIMNMKMVMVKIMMIAANVFECLLYVRSITA